MTQALLFIEMVEAMKKVASLNVELTVEERNLLSVAYKNVIGARRASWRIISNIEQKEENKGADEKLEMIRQYRSQVEKELRDICADILGVLDQHLIPCASTGESKVFYYKMWVSQLGSHLHETRKIAISINIEPMFAVNLALLIEITLLEDCDCTHDW